MQPRKTGAVSLLLLALPAVFLAGMAWSRRWVAEDAFIDFRVVRQLLAGHGPVFNLAERVEAYTNPLWVAILAAWKALGGPLELGSVVLGLAFTMLGLLAGQCGALRLARGLSEARAVSARALILPLGALVFAAVPGAWDFATSGMESGLAIGWLGVSFCSIASLAGGGTDESTGALRSSQWSWLATALLIGLGPLIRPDLAIFSFAFFVALATSHAFQTPRPAIASRVMLGLAAALAPIAYEIFRMGYFAAMVPNTALAKEAGLAYWPQGLRYLADFAGTYGLWLPLALLLVPGGALLRTARSSARRPVVVALLAPVMAAVLHALYVVRVGGDFMHARLLLPSLFGALLPVAVVLLPTRSSAAAIGMRLLAAGIGAWSLVCAAALRPGYELIGPEGISNERSFFAILCANRNPVTAAEHEAWGPAHLTVQFPGRAPRLLVLDESDSTLGARQPFFWLARGVRADLEYVTATENIGITGFNAGLDVHLVDRGALGDPIASRLRLLARGRPGHEKLLPNAWIIARYADLSRTPPAADLGPGGSGQLDLARGVAADSAGGGPPGIAPQVAAALATLGCGDVRRLLDAIEQPLTARRFLANLWLAPRLDRLRIDPDPKRAKRKICGERSAPWTPFIHEDN